MLEHKMLESIIAKYVFIMGNRMRWELKWKNIYVTIKKGMFEQKKTLLLKRIAFSSWWCSHIKYFTHHHLSPHHTFHPVLIAQQTAFC